MKIFARIARLRPRTTKRRRPEPASMSARDWADLPVYHPPATES